MEESVLLLNMTFLLLVGAICSVIFKKLKMPIIIGYLVTGIILANYWVGESPDTELIVALLADLGLVLLMFCIGMELNLKKIRKIGMFALMVMMIQVPLIMAGGYVFGMFMGWNALQSIVFGAIISGSSTAVVTAILADQNILSKEEASTVILITVVEDVAQVLILSMLSPMLIGTSMGLGSIVWMLVVIVLFMVVAIGVGVVLVPKLIDWIGDKMPGEVLLVASLGMCFAMSLLSVYIGMSMAIGAFMMGVIVSQSKYCKKIEEDVTPIKNIFMAMFFISIGLEITPSELIGNIGMILLFFLVYFILKVSTVMLAYFVGNKSLHLSYMSALSLAAMGEFAFIIAKAGLDSNVISSSFYTSVVGAALLSMVVLPIITKQADRIYSVAREKSPEFVKKIVRGAEKIQHDSYAKMSLSSKTTSRKFRKKLTATYVEILIIGVMAVAFYFGSPYLTEFICNNSGSLDYGMSSTIVLFICFLALLIPLYQMVKNMKFVEKYLLDIERRAEELGKGNLQSKWSRFHKGVLKTNIWLIVFFADFLILMFMPSPVEFLGHVAVMLSGMGVILLLYFLKYWKKN